jgi:1-acyl-sn-glycerol-3-phosphate acyltransferase
MAVLRAARLLLHILVGLALACAVGLDRRRRLERERLMHWWTSTLLDVLDIELRVAGEPLAGPRLTVANHVSWLDIAVIGACEPTRFLSKSEVKDWPVAGWLAAAAGTFYIRRGKGGSEPLLHKLVPHLRAGGTIVLFPEGTTTDGHSVGTFHSRLFAAAIDSGCPVQPVALRYERNACGEAIAPFIGDDDLFSHVLRVLRNPGLVAQISYGVALSPANRSRDQLADAARASIVGLLAQPPLPAADAATEGVLHF